MENTEWSALGTEVMHKGSFHVLWDCNIPCNSQAGALALGSLAGLAALPLDALGSLAKPEDQAAPPLDTAEGAIEGASEGA